MKRVIETNKAPRALGPYSQAIETEEYIFVSGMLGIEPSSGKLEEGIEKQMQRILKNLEAILKEAGMTLSHVVKTTIFLKNLKDFSRLNEVYSRYFSPPYPARTTVEVSNLPKGALIEMEAIAVKKI